MEEAKVVSRLHDITKDAREHSKKAKSLAQLEKLGWTLDTAVQKVVQLVLCCAENDASEGYDTCTISSYMLCREVANGAVERLRRMGLTSDYIEYVPLIAVSWAK